jgi:hypothetical protein
MKFTLPKPPGRLPVALFHDERNTVEIYGKVLWKYCGVLTIALFSNNSIVDRKGRIIKKKSERRGLKGALRKQFS